MRLKNGDVYFGWEALFESAHNPECVGRVVRDDEPRGQPTPYDDTFGFVNNCRVLELASGRGLAYWSNGGGFFGRMIARNGEISPTPVDLTVSGMSLARPFVFALDTGFAGFFVRFPPGGGFEINLQVYDDDGLKEGPPFVVVPTVEEFGIQGGLGLANGKIVVLRLSNTEGELTGRIFTRAGRRQGKVRSMARNVTFNNALPAVALPGSGLLLALEDGTFDVKRIVFTRFGDDLRKVGAAASTRRLTGLVRTDLKLLDDGRAAGAYVVDASRVFVAIVDP